MNHTNHKLIFFSALAFVAVSMLALWLLNVVSALFGGPELQYKDALALLILLAIVRFATTARHGRRVRPHDVQAR